MKKPFTSNSAPHSSLSTLLKRIGCVAVAMAISTLFTGCYFSLEQPFTTQANCEATTDLNGIWKSTDGMKYLSIDTKPGNVYEIKDRSFDMDGKKHSERLIASFPYEIGFRQILVSIDGGTTHYGAVDDSTLEAAEKSKGKWAYLLFSLHQNNSELELAMLDIKEENNSFAGVREAMGNLHKKESTDSMGNWQKTTLGSLPTAPRTTDLIAYQAKQREIEAASAQRAARSNLVKAGNAAIQRVMAQLNNELAAARNGTRDQQVAAYGRIAGINIAGCPADFQATWRPFATTAANMSNHLHRLPDGSAEAFIEGALYGLLDETDTFVDLSKQRIADTINLSDRLNFQLSAVRASAGQLRIAR